MTPSGANVLQTSRALLGAAESELRNKANSVSSRISELAEHRKFILRGNGNGRVRLVDW